MRNSPEWIRTTVAGSKGQHDCPLQYGAVNKSEFNNLKAFDRFQFERLGYFCIDKDSKKDNLIINRTITLRDTWAKVQQQMKK